MKKMANNKISTSLIFKFSERVLVKGIGLIVSIVLARLLTPEIFGEIAIIMVFINLSQVIIQSGFNTALVQNKDIVEQDYSTVFYINIFTSLFIIIILWFCSPFIADYYSLPSLVMPLRIYSLSLVIGALNSVQLARLQRKMAFKINMICSLAATILSGMLGIFAAYYFKNIWSLIIYYVSNLLFVSLAILIADRWIPKLTFSFARAKKMFGYGWKMLVSGVLCSLYSDVRSLIIGKYYSTESLAFYNRGQQFPNIVSTTIDTSVQSVMFPALSSAQESKERMVGLLRKTLKSCSFFVFPAMIGLCVVAEPFVSIILTEKWIQCVPFLQLICLAEVTVPLTSSNLIAIKSTGRSDYYMILEIIRRIAMIAVLLVSVICFKSLFAIAIGYIISSWLDVLIIIIAEKKILGYGLFGQFLDMFKIFMSTLIMGLITYALGMYFENMLIRLIVQLIVGVVTYLGMCLILNEPTLKSMVSLVRRK